MLALTKFNDNISNVDINEARQFLLARINNEFKLICPIQTKTLSPKNTTKPWIYGEICAYCKKKQNYYSLVRQNKMRNQLYALFKIFVTN